MEKACSVTIVATIHDAVHKIQDEPNDPCEQVDSFVSSSPFHLMIRGKYF